MMDEGKLVSIRQLCCWFDVPRSTFYYKPCPRTRKPLDKEVVEVVRKIIKKHPHYGLRRIAALVQKGSCNSINRKKIHRIIKINVTAP